MDETDAQNSGWGCGHEDRTWQLLHGNLEGSEQKESLSHLRHCAWCRETVESRARDVRRELRPASEAANALRSPRPLGVGGWFSKSVSPGGSRTLMLAVGLGVVVLFVMSSGGKAKSKVVPENSIAEAALVAGNPWVIEPNGAISDFPRVVSAWIPIGATSVDVTIRDAEGTLVYRASFVPGKSGVVSAPDVITSDSNAHRVMKVALPLPASTELNVTRGATYGVMVGCGPQSSSARVFQIASS